MGDLPGACLTCTGPFLGSAKRLLSLGYEGVTSDHVTPALPLLLRCPKGAAVPQHDQGASAQLAFGIWRVPVAWRNWPT